jgi:hypothetical protein
MMTFLTQRFTVLTFKITFFCLLAICNLYAFSLAQNPSSVINSLEFKNFHNVSKFINCNTTLNGTKDPWFVGLNDKKVSKSYKANSIEWRYEELKIVFFHNSNFYVNSHTMGVSGQSIVFDKKSQKLNLYDFEVEKLNFDNTINILKTGIDNNGRYFQKGTFNLLSNEFEWGRKDY